MAFFVGPLSDEAGNAVARLQGDPAAAAAWQHLFELQLRLDRPGRARSAWSSSRSFCRCSPICSGAACIRSKRADRCRIRLRGSSRRRSSPTSCGRSGCRAWRELRAFDWRVLPKRLLIFNTVVMCVYAIGVQASFLASVLDVGVARTAISLSGVVNGIGTIAFTLFVDPTSAIITDQAIHGKRSVEEVRSMVFYLIADGHHRIAALAGDPLSGRRRYRGGCTICRACPSLGLLASGRCGAAARCGRLRRFDRALDRQYAGPSGRRRPGARQRARRRARVSAGAAGRPEGSAGARGLRRGRGRARAAASTRKGNFDDALATVNGGLAVDPQSARARRAQGDDRAGQTSTRDRALELSRPTARPDWSMQRAYSQLNVDERALLLQDLKRFGYTFDADDLTAAIKRSYELQLELAKNTNRLILYRQLVTSGAPEAPSQSTTFGAALPAAAAVMQ